MVTGHLHSLKVAPITDAGEVRRGVRGSREVPYRATGKSWQLEVAGGGQAVLAAFLAEAEQVPAADLETTRLGLRLTAEGLAELRRRLFDLLEEFRARPVEEGAEPWSVFVALHPDHGRR